MTARGAAFPLTTFLHVSFRETNFLLEAWCPYLGIRLILEAPEARR